MAVKPEKFIIGMSHFGALPGDPEYRKGDSLDRIASNMLEDVRALTDGGADAVMFSNESSRPWMLTNGNETMTAMAYILGKMRKQITLPFGVHVIWDAKATLSLAAATEADFAWEVYKGAYCSDYGLWSAEPGDYMRQADHLSGKRLKLLCEVLPESAVPMGTVRPLAAGQNMGVADYICVAGIRPGTPPSLETLRKIKRGKSGLIVSTGMRTDNVLNYLSVADGAIIGSAFKKDGKLFNGVDAERVKRMMDLVRGLTEG